jgi:hypothetical protein
MSEFAEVAEQQSADFDRIVAPLTDRLWRAFVARFGVEVGSDVHAETVAWAWQHRDRLGELTNPAGYLFRVGQSALDAINDGAGAPGCFRWTSTLRRRKFPNSTGTFCRRFAS